MSDDFTPIWNKRLSSNPKDQEQLYLAIRQIFKHSKYYYSFNNEYDRDDFFNSFYEKKILVAIKNKRAITTPEYDNYALKRVYKMLKNYHIDCFREQKNEWLTPQNRLDIDTFETANTTNEDVFKPLSMEEQKQLFDGMSPSIPFDSMVKEAIIFLDSADDWVYPLILNRVEGKSLSSLPKSIKSSHSKLAMLGWIPKGSHYSGATSRDDYHKATLIGKWIVNVYGYEFIPIDDDFFIIILKTLRRATLFIKDNGDNRNGQED